MPQFWGTSPPPPPSIQMGIPCDYLINNKVTGASLPTETCLSQDKSCPIATAHKGTAVLTAYSAIVPQNSATIHLFLSSSGHSPNVSPLHTPSTSILSLIPIF